MKKYDVLIIGGGAAGMSCALVLGSAQNKAYAQGKSIGLVLHQRSSSLENALFNNVLGLEPGTLGKDLMQQGKTQLQSLYPHVDLIEKEKVLAVERSAFEDTGYYKIKTNKQELEAKYLVVAVGPSNLFAIEGLEDFLIAHENLPPHKERVQLKNQDHLVEGNIYVAGVLAGWRSQFAIAAGSGAHVATIIMTAWNNGLTSMVHDSIPKKTQ